MAKLEVYLPPVVDVRNVADADGNDAAVILVAGLRVLAREGHVDEPRHFADRVRGQLESWLRHILLTDPDGSPSWLGEDRSRFGTGWGQGLPGLGTEIREEAYGTTRLVCEPRGD